MLLLETRGGSCPAEEGLLLAEWVRSYAISPASHVCPSITLSVTARVTASCAI